MDTILPCMLSFIISYLSAFFTFTSYFKDPIVNLVRAWEMHGYLIFNALFTAFTFQLVNIIDVSIVQLNLNEHPFMVAIFLGIAGHTFLLSLFKSRGDINSTISNNFNNFFDQIQAYFFHRYAVKRNEYIHSEIKIIMKDFPPDRLNELVLKCQIITDEISESDSQKLIYKIEKIFSYDIPGESKVIPIGLELSKFLGIKLIKDFSKQVIDDDKFRNSKKSAETLLQQIRKTFLATMEEVKNEK